MRAQYEVHVGGPASPPASVPPPLLLLPLLLLLETPELLELLLPLEDPLDPLDPLELPELLLVASLPPSDGFAPVVSSPHASHAAAEAIVSAPMRLIPRSVFVMTLPYSGVR
jgi:hypothetical protein